MFFAYQYHFHVMFHLRKFSQKQQNTARPSMFSLFFVKKKNKLLFRFYYVQFFENPTNLNSPNSKM